ncbi:MAG: autotransporter outer membrane beta-barrel domain-containing protein, partial [Aestuariivirga sp.]|nr:autotransporter outer membrane beta-barrel domain-containing protein [Aestuariivirga sp.]
RGNGGSGINFESGVNYVFNQGEVYGGEGRIAGSGILVQSGTVEIDNLGLLIGGVGDVQRGFGINNRGGTVVRLTNAQGGRDGGGSVDPLTYTGALPEFYEIVFNGPTSYGQLEVINEPEPETESGPEQLATGPRMRVGVSSLSTNLSSGVAKNVIIGVDPDDIENETVVFKVSDGVLGIVYMNPDSEGTDWDVRLWNYSSDLVAPSQYMLDQNALVLRYAISTYDCKVFDENGFCIGASASFGKYGPDVDDGASDAGALLGTIMAAKRLGSQVRVGLFMQFGSVDGDDDEAVDVTSTMPMLGAFAGFSEMPEGDGWQALISGAYQQGEVDYSRSALLGPEDITKSSNGDFETYGVYGELGYGFRFGGGILLTPFVGLAASQATRDGYEESGPGGYSFGDVTVTQVTGIAGARLEGVFGDNFTYRLGAAIEHDFSYDVDDFTVMGDDFGTSSFASDMGPSEWRMSGTAGVGYLIAPNKEIRLDGYVSQFSDDDALNYAITAGFRFGF